MSGIVLCSLQGTRFRTAGTLVLLAAICLAGGCATSSAFKPEVVPPDYDALTKDAEIKIETFIEHNPDDPRYTPEAMLRLSEIYIEKALDILEQGDPDSEAQQEAARVELEKATELLWGILEWFPDYQRREITLYQLGYCLEELGQPDSARDTFRRLTEEYPSSRFVPEAWARIGEYHFQSGQLSEAIVALSNVLEHPESEFYHLALYKRAWSYYRADKMEPAIRDFARVVNDADAGEAETTLRPEALQYIALSLAEPDWNGNGRRDRGFPLKRALRLVGAEPFAGEVLIGVGIVLAKQEMRTEALTLFRHVEKTYPELAIDRGVGDRIDAIEDTP